ncbi:hypothetical protein RR46_14981 [Papilio xuthus]|uniref:Uncharacterized protein n=1 Tax=Papilio xuthus TaxID=66420 RepID=A0A194PDZ0_PAPXU|nr:hypothetical protein RR46_14981 [Papilio xuthus]
MSTPRNQLATQNNDYMDHKVKDHRQIMAVTQIREFDI